MACSAGVGLDLAKMASPFESSLSCCGNAREQMVSLVFQAHSPLEWILQFPEHVQNLLMGSTPSQHPCHFQRWIRVHAQWHLGAKEKRDQN